MKNNVLIVVGMHRSGTSLLAQWVHKSGISMGEDLMPPLFSNKDGHFEDMDFYNLHESIFKEKGIPFGGFSDFEKLKLNELDRLRMHDLVVSKNISKKQWGWKEPRTCIFLENYLNLLPNAKVMVVIRDFKAVINSLIERELKFKKEKLASSEFKYTSQFLRKIKIRKQKIVLGKRYSKAVIFYYQSLLNTLEGFNRDNLMIVNFEDILKEETKLRDQISSWGFELKHSSFDAIFKPQYITAKESSHFVYNKKLLKKLEVALKTFN